MTVVASKVGEPCRVLQAEKSPDGALISEPKFVQLDFSETDDHNSSDEQPSQMPGKPLDHPF